MKVASITTLFPPAVIGGAEVSASNLATRLVGRGHDVTVLSTTVRSDEKEVKHEVFRDAVRVHREPMPRSYTAYNFADHSQLEKLVWHAQDHLDWRNRGVWGRFLDDKRPDFVLVHVAQGLGFNGLAELGKRDIPTIVVLHDLSLACYKTSMFTGGRTCEGQCTVCGLSSRLKSRFLSTIPRLGFVSPSLSNYRTVAKHVPIGDRPYRIILNANEYETPKRVPAGAGGKLRLVYAGQISRSKGVEFLLRIVKALAGAHDISLVVVGGGPELERLKAEYGNESWVEFTGKVTQSEVSRRMVESDVLCAPSLWPDNSPGVIIQAMTAGIPVLGSDKGGIPELVQDGVTGAVLEAGNEEAWSAAIVALARDRAQIERWSASTLLAADRFDPEASVTAYLRFAEEIMRTAA